MNKQYRYLFKNVGVLTVSSFASKFLVFFLVPLYTNVLTTEEYGSYDLLYSTVQMLAPVLCINMIDAVIRFALGTERNFQREVFSVGAKYIILAVIAMTVITAMGALTFHVRILQQYWLEFILLFLSYIVHDFVLQFARAIEDIKGVAIAGVLATVSLITFNLAFLLWLEIGLKGYFLACILSLLVPSIYLFFRDRMHQYYSWYIWKFRIGDMERDMFRYAFPLLFNNLSWYINGVSDRYVVTWFAGMEANGLYSVAYKIPAILNAMQTVFIQAWQISAIKEYGGKKSDDFYRSVYKGTQLIMIPICSCLILGTRILAKILFAKDFFQAWIYVPVLLPYVMLNTFSGVIGGLLSATKETKAFSKSALVGASVNIILNFILIYFLGAMGAAIATLISSVVIWKMRLFYAKKYIDYQVNKTREFILLTLLFVQAALLICIPTDIGYGIQVLFVAAIVGISFLNLKSLHSEMK